MNVFVIPSWYPGDMQPLAGLFIAEQVRTLAALRPRWTLAVSLWAQDSSTVILKRPRTVPAALRAAAQPPSRRRAANVCEYDHPVLSWSHRLLSGRISALLDANRHNLRRAMSDAGAIDLIHAHVSYPAGWIAMELSRESGIPYVITEHMGPFPFPEFLAGPRHLKEIVALPLSKAAAVIAVSPALRGQIEQFGIHGVAVIPNLVDERFFRPAETGSPDDRIVFFTLARIEPDKGILDLLNAARELLDSLPEEAKRRVSFRIGGDGTMRGRYAKEASRMRIDGEVTWLGRLTRHQARAEYQRCTGFVLASRWESFGLVLVEAMACGKPVIATRCGGPETIVTAENGILVDVADRPQLAQAMRSVVERSVRFDSARIREQCVERFGGPAVVARIEEMYSRALAA